METEELKKAVAAIPYWYHKIALPGGIVTPGWAPMDPSKYQIPTDLRGKVVLDIGAWDGYWAFEALHRGAKRVVAIDDFSDTIGSVVNAVRSDAWQTFDLCSEVLGFHGRVLREGYSVYDLESHGLHYDIIFCFGVLYHLRHPLLALEKIKSVCEPGAELYIETATLDGCVSPFGPYGYTGNESVFEFYPGREYGDNPSNWWVGTLPGWCKIVEAAGFTVVDRWRFNKSPKSVAEARGFIKAVA